MRLIQAPLIAPPHCCGITRRDDGDIVDFEQEIACMEQPHLYLHRAVVEEAAALLGMVSAKEVEALKVQLAEFGQKLEETQETLNLAAEFEDHLRERTAA